MKGIIVLKDFHKIIYTVHEIDKELHVPYWAQKVMEAPEPMPMSKNIVYENINNLTLGQIWQEGYNACLKEILDEGWEEDDKNLF